MDMNTIQSDLNTILDDLQPTNSKPESPVPEISTEKIIITLREINRLTQELITTLQSVGNSTIPALPITMRVTSPTIPQFGLTTDNGSVLEGHFNGERMIGDDGKDYNVPPNYASKSKLVTGDRMKLTITASGAFIYKQIGPINRKRVIGALEFDPEHNHWRVRPLSNPEITYKVLAASISFYKGKPGDEVILFVPESTPCEWAAVDQLIAK